MCVFLCLLFPNELLQLKVKDEEGNVAAESPEMCVNLINDSNQKGAGKSAEAGSKAAGTTIISSEKMVIETHELMYSLF